MTIAARHKGQIDLAKPSSVFNAESNSPQLGQCHRTILLFILLTLHALLKINILFDPIAQYYRQYYFDTIGDDEGQHTKAKGAQDTVAYILQAINRNKP